MDLIQMVLNQNMTIRVSRNSKNIFDSCRDKYNSKMNLIGKNPWK